MRIHNFLLVAIAAAGTGAALAKAPAQELKLVPTESRVEVDSEGRVVSIHTTPELPGAARATIEANIRQLRFAPPLKDGRAVPGVTFVQQDACAAPDIGGAWNFVAQVRGNGPSLETPVVPAYPHDAERAGSQARWKVTYAIATDGSATLLEATRADSKDRFNAEYQAVLSKWIQAMHFQPELLDGQPVATKMETWVEFKLSSGRMARNAEAMANDSCVAALKAHDDDDRPVALDSPFRLLPVN